MKWCVCVGVAVVLAFGGIASANLLTNPDFESGDLTGWATFGQGWRTGSGGDAHGGTWGVVCDVLSTDGDEWRGLLQAVPVSEGQLYEYLAYQRIVIPESSESWLELQWLNDVGGVISQTQTVHLSAEQSYTLTGFEPLMAPGGAVTASVRAIVHMTSAPAVNGDFHTFDDFSFQAVPEPGTLALLGLGAVAGIAWRHRRKR